MNIACLPGFGKSTRTCHFPSAVVAVKVHGVVESHLPLTWRLATSIAPSLSRAAAHGAQEAKAVATIAASARGTWATMLGSKPIICDTSPISWQVFKAPKPVEMVDGKVRHSLRFAQPHVDRHATPTLFVGLQRPPIHHAATCGAEMEPERLAPDVRLARTRDMDAFAFEVISAAVMPPSGNTAVVEGATLRGALRQTQRRR